MRNEAPQVSNHCALRRSKWVFSAARGYVATSSRHDICSTLLPQSPSVVFIGVGDGSRLRPDESQRHHSLLYLISNV